MVKVLLVVILIIAIYVCYKIYQKYKISHQFFRDRVKRNHKKNVAVSFAQHEEQEILAYDIDLDEQRLFDDVATLFMSEKIHLIEKIQACKIQANVLKKMPLATRAVIQNHDLEDWSIYWVLQNQSLEYFVSRYGVFITHVDRDGNENKDSHLHEQNKTRFSSGRHQSSYFEL